MFSKRDGDGWVVEVRGQVFRFHDEAEAKRLDEAVVDTIAHAMELGRELVRKEFKEWEPDAWAHLNSPEVVSQRIREGIARGARLRAELLANSAPT